MISNAKPCPWCRGRRLWVWAKMPGHPSVACSNPNCAAVGPSGRDLGEAVAFWNSAPRSSADRPIPAALRCPRLLDRLMAEMHPPDAESEA